MNVCVISPHSLLYVCFPGTILLFLPSETFPFLHCSLLYWFLISTGLGIAFAQLVLQAVFLGIGVFHRRKGLVSIFFIRLFLKLEFSLFNFSFSFLRFLFSFSKLSHLASKLDILVMQQSAAPLFLICSSHYAYIFLFFYIVFELYKTSKLQKKLLSMPENDFAIHCNFSIS